VGDTRLKGSILECHILKSTLYHLSSQPSPRNKAKQGVEEIPFLLSVPRIESSFTNHIINSILFSPITENVMNRKQKILISSSGTH